MVVVVVVVLVVLSLLSLCPSDQAAVVSVRADT